MDNRLALMTGIDFLLEESQLIIHQPSLKEISYIGEQEFFTGIQFLCLNKSMCDVPGLDLSEVTNFDIFMEAIKQPEVKDIKEIIIQVLNILFPSYSITMTPRSILFNQNDTSVMLDRENFEPFQKQLNQMFCLVQTGQQAYNPKGKKARDIAKKLQLAREKVAKQQIAESGGSLSVLSQYLSVITVGVGSMSLKDSMELTIYQLYDLVERYSLYLNWDIDIRSRLAGAKVDKPVENWMKSIH